MSKFQHKKLSAETERFLQEHFESKDVDKNGYLDISELKECLKILGFHDPPEDDVVFLQKYLDSDGNGRLEIKELVENAGFINHHLYKKSAMMAAFKKYDVDGDQQIRLPEMLSVLMQEGLTEPKARTLLRRLCDKYDINYDSKFNYAEFSTFALEEDYNFFRDLPLDTQCQKR